MAFQPHRTGFAANNGKVFAKREPAIPAKQLKQVSRIFANL